MLPTALRCIVYKYHECWSFHSSEYFGSGNRISCLIENLHSDKRQDSEEECVEDEDETQEELKFGKRKLSVHMKCVHMTYRTQENV